MWETQRKINVRARELSGVGVFCERDIALEVSSNATWLAPNGFTIGWISVSRIHVIVQFNDKPIKR